MTYLFTHQTFTDHVHHIDLVLDKYTSAGFTVNAPKYQFCKPEIKFLGHVISDGVKADHERIEEIFRYPVPKNQQQLRKFLGIPNFHHQLILNYFSYVKPLHILLRKGNKSLWTDALQQTFEIVRAKFAHNIQLMYPYEKRLDYKIGCKWPFHRLSLITGKR